MNKSFFVPKVAAAAAAFLLAFCFMLSCSQSLKTGEIAANQSNTSGKTPSPSPTQLTKTKTEDEPPPVDLSKAEPVSYCDLVRNPAQYDRKIVRVRAIYFTAFEKTYLYDERCEAGQPPAAPKEIPAETWAQWDKSLVTQGDSDEAKLNVRLRGFGSKDVTVTGRFSSTNDAGDKNSPNLFGHMNCCRFQFSIMRLEKPPVIIEEK